MHDSLISLPPPNPNLLNTEQLLIYFMLIQFAPFKHGFATLKCNDGKVTSFIIPDTVAQKLLGGGITYWLNGVRNQPTDFTGNAQDPFDIYQHSIRTEQGGTIGALRNIFAQGRLFRWNLDKYMLAFAAFNVLTAELAEKSQFIPLSEFKEGGVFPGERTGMVWGVTENKQVCVTWIDSETFGKLFVYGSNTMNLIREHMPELNNRLPDTAYVYSRSGLKMMPWPQSPTGENVQLILSTGKAIDMRRPHPSEQNALYFSGMEILATPNEVYMRFVGGRPGEQIERTYEQDVVKLIAFLIKYKDTLFEPSIFKSIDQILKVIQSRSLAKVIEVMVQVFGEFMINAIILDPTFQTFYIAAGRYRPSSQLVDNKTNLSESYNFFTKVDKTFQDLKLINSSELHPSEILNALAGRTVSDIQENHRTLAKL